MAERVGIEIDKNTALRAAAPYTRASGGSPRYAPRSSKADAVISPNCANSRSERRSRRSICGPKPTETTSIGTSWNTPISPTANDDLFVNWYTWANSATSVNWLPICDSNSPAQSKRKSRERAAG